MLSVVNKKSNQTRRPRLFQAAAPCANCSSIRLGFADGVTAAFLTAPYSGCGRR